MNDNDWAATLDTSWVRGVVANFDDAVRRWQIVRDDSAHLDAEFSRFASGVQSGNFAGQAAQAFSTLVADCETAVKDLPLVSGDIGRVLHDHADRLRGLQDSARLAVAQAKTNWRVLHDAQAASAQTNQRRSVLTQQIREVSLSGDPAQQTQVTSLLNEEATVADAAHRNSHAVNAAHAAVDGDKHRYQELVADELQLNHETAVRLGHIDLRSLRDPTLLERIGHSVGGFFSDLAHNIADLCDALVDGDWQRALWDLRGVLESLITIVGAVALVVALVASGGTLALVLAGISLGLAVAMFATDTALFTTKSVNPTTGETISGWTLVMDGIKVVLAAVSLKGAINARANGPRVEGGWSTNANKDNVVRVFIKQELGVDVYKAGKATSVLGLPANNYHFLGRLVDQTMKDPSKIVGIGIKVYERSQDINHGIELVTGDGPRPTDAAQKFLLREIQKTKIPPASLSSPSTPHIVRPFAVVKAAA